MCNKVYTAIVCTTICVTCLLAAKDEGSGAADQNTLNISAVDYPVTIPWQVLKQLLDISDKSSGLFTLWINAISLTKDRLLKDKSKACRGILFHDIQRPAFCKEPDTCLNRTQLVNYYNELVIQLRIAEHLVNISIIREIQEKYRTEVESKERKIIELLHYRILPLLDFVLNTTSDEVNCNSTEQIVDQKMLTYNNCSSIQASNLVLSKTTVDLYHIFVHIYYGKNYSSKASEMIIIDHDGTEEWCVFQ